MNSIHHSDYRSPKLPYVIPDHALSWNASFIHRFYELCRTSPERKLKVLCTTLSSSGTGGYSGKIDDTEYVNMSLGLFGDLFFGKDGRKDTGEATMTASDTFLSSQDQFYLAQCSIYASSPSFPASVSSSPFTIPTTVSNSDSSSSVSSSSSSTELPELYSAVQLLPSAMLPPLPVQHLLKEINLWINIDPAYSRTHYDTEDNYLTVLQGCKEVRVISPQGMQELMERRIATEPSYPPTSHGTSTVSSSASSSGTSLPSSSPSIHHHSVDLFDLQIKYPSLIQSFTIPTGSSLFIPEGWWHAVKSESRTIAVNYWYEGIGSSLATEPGHQLPYLIDCTIQFYKLSLIRKLRQEWIEKSFHEFTQYIRTDTIDESVETKTVRHVWQRIPSFTVLQNLPSNSLSLSTVGDTLWSWIQYQLQCLSSMNSSDTRYVSIVHQINNVFLFITANNALCYYIFTLIVIASLTAEDATVTMPTPSSSPSYISIPSDNVLVTLSNLWTDPVWDTVIHLWETVPILSSLIPSNEDTRIEFTGSTYTMDDTVPANGADGYERIPNHVLRTLPQFSTWSTLFFDVWWTILRVPNSAVFCLRLQQQIDQTYVRPLLRQLLEKFM